MLNKIPFATFEIFKATEFLCPSLLGKDGLQLSYCDLRFALRLMNRTACKFYIIIIIIIIIDKFRNLKNILRSYS